jgi:hypothetical protein
VDPEPDPTLLAGSGSRKIIPNPDPSRTGSEFILKSNYSEKLIKFGNFSTKMLYLKI